jgi:hypothetical protein
MFADGHGGRA